MLAVALLAAMPPLLAGSVDVQDPQVLVDELELVEAQATPSGPRDSLEWSLVWTAPLDGELHAWVVPGRDRVNLVALGPDGSVLGEASPRDRRTPCLGLTVFAGQHLDLIVTLAGAPDGARLRLALAPETAQTRTAARRIETAAREVRNSAAGSQVASRRAALVQALAAAMELAGGEGSDAVARARIGSRVSLRNLGELELAEETARRGVAHMAVARPADHPDHLKALHDLGLAFSINRKLDQALELQQRTMEMVARVHDPEERESLNAMQALAITLARRKETLQARRLFEEVLEVQQRTHPEDMRALASARNNLAAVMAQMGDLYGAVALFEEVLAAQLQFLAPEHGSVQITRHNLANSLRVLGDLQPAREILEEVVRVREALGDPSTDPRLQDSLAELAGVYAALGQLGPAEEIHRRVLASRQEVLGEDHLDLLAAHENLALVLSARGEQQEATEHFERVLEGRRRVLAQEDHELQRARRNLSNAFALAGDGPALEALVLELGAGLVALPARSMGRLSPRELEHRVVQAELDLSTLLSAGHPEYLTGSSPRLRRLSFEAVAELGAAALRGHALARFSTSESLPAELDRPVREANEALTRLALDGAAPAELAAARVRLDAAERRRLNELAADPRVGPLLAPLRLESLAAQLGEQTALVAYRTYTLFPDPGGGDAQSQHAIQLVAFVLRSDASLERFELGPRARIRRAVEEWRGALTVDPLRGASVPGDPRADQQLEAGDALRALVLDPLEDALDGVRTLVVVPDAELHGVPLDALPQAGGLVGERFAVETRLALWDLLLPENPIRGTTELVVLGGASFNASPEPQGRETLAMAATGPERGLSGAADVLRGSPWERGFAPLPATLDEARAIAALFEEGMQATDEPTLLLGKEASRLRLRGCAPRARWLHLATHGWFAPESVRSMVDPGPLDESLSTLQRLSREEVVRGTSPMLLCGLALAGANQPPDDLGRIGGILTAAEFSSWDLRQCELAVLSACDTNVGVTRAGQGVASLQMALHMAGARSVITSLWKVPDQATQELMTDFYRRLWFGGRTKARALWEAKMRMRDARDPQGRPRFTPRDWAGWVLSGDPE